MFIDSRFEGLGFSVRRSIVLTMMAATMIGWGCSPGESRRIDVVTSQGPTDQRDSLHEAARQYLSALQAGEPGDLGQTWDMAALYEKAFEDDHRLASDEDRASHVQLLTEGLGQALVSPAFRAPLEGLTIESLESDRQDETTFWVALRLVRQNSEASELLLYAKQDGDSWRWLDLGRPGALLSDELRSTRSADQNPLEEFLPTLKDRGDSIARVVPVIEAPMVPPLPEIDDLSFPEEAPAPQGP